jgi:hypothetical protein
LAKIIVKNLFLNSLKGLASAFYLEKDVHEVVELWTAEDNQAKDVAEDAHGGHQRTQHSIEQRPHLQDK